MNFRNHRMNLGHPRSNLGISGTPPIIFRNPGSRGRNRRPIGFHCLVLYNAVVSVNVGVEVYYPHPRHDTSSQHANRSPMPPRSLRVFVIYIHTYMHMYIYIYIYIYLLRYTYTHMCIYTHGCISMYIYSYLYVYI